jgi:hypothetical protein
MLRRVSGDSQATLRTFKMPPPEIAKNANMPMQTGRRYLALEMEPVMNV